MMADSTPAQMKSYAKRRKKNFAAVPFRGSISLLTTAANTVVDAPMFDSVLLEDLFCLSADVTAQIRGLTATEGPTEFGFAHSDYSEGEVEEYLSVSYIGPDNKIEQERARRAIRRIGSFSGLDTNEEFNDGRKYRQVVKFTIGNGFNMNVWAANRSAGAYTTGASLTFQGTMYGRWQR